MGKNDLNDLEDSEDQGDEQRRAGRIIADSWISCGICHRAAALDVPKRRLGAAKALAWGWKHTKAHGWVCPVCLPR